VVGADGTHGSVGQRRQLAYCWVHPYRGAIDQKWSGPYAFRTDVSVSHHILAVGLAACVKDIKPNGFENVAHGCCRPSRSENEGPLVVPF